MCTFVKTKLKMKKTAVIAMLILGVFVACRQADVTRDAVDLTGFARTELNGVTTVEKRNDAGQLLERGYLVRGVRQGVWSTYYPNTGRVKSITGYVNGKKNGTHMLMDSRGYPVLEEHYRDDLLHGRSARYKNNRISEVSHYKDGLLDGVYISYFPYTQDPQRMAMFRKGKQHGMMEYYDDKGNVTIRFEYKNGEKVAEQIISDE